jgi:proteasome lid subunit RPN8/RPN11
MKLSRASLALIKCHAIEAYPDEACGLLIREGRSQVYVPCTNLAASAEAHFRLDPKCYAAAEDRGAIIAVVHSHPDSSAAPSEADRVSCEASGVPWVIVEVRRNDDGMIASGEHVTLEPSDYKAPLMGRSFHHGTLDCYQIVVDYYQRELGISLKDFVREDDWWSRGGDLYIQHYAEAGFAPVQDLQQGDVILMQVRSPVTNHAGIYLADGILQTEPQHYPAPGTILHHLYGRDSGRDVYGGYWAEATRLVLRHKEMMR